MINGVLSMITAALKDLTLKAGRHRVVNFIISFPSSSWNGMDTDAPKIMAKRIKKVSR